MLIITMEVKELNTYFVEMHRLITKYKLNKQFGKIVNIFIHLTREKVGFTLLTESYIKACKLVNEINAEKSKEAMSKLSELTNLDYEQLIRVFLAKELVQIQYEIDAEDSIMDFFGWLLLYDNISSNRAST